MKGEGNGGRKKKKERNLGKNMKEEEKKRIVRNPSSFIDNSISKSTNFVFMEEKDGAGKEDEGGRREGAESMRRG